MNKSNTSQLISVVIPIYNAEDTLRECVQSVLRQSYPDYELILVDDGSSDNSSTICDEYAKGAWIAFVDSDDQLEPHALEKFSERIDEQTDIIFGNGSSLSIPETKTIGIQNFRHLAVLGEGTIGVPWGSLFRKELLTPYIFDLPKELEMGEDYIYWLRMIFTTERPVAVIKEKASNTPATTFIGQLHIARCSISSA